MVTDEELKKIQRNAKNAVEDGRRGLTITLAMDPVVMFAITSELLHYRGVQKLTRYLDPRERKHGQPGD